MFHKIKGKTIAALAAVLTVLSTGIPSYAMIPATGDGSGATLPIVIGLLAVSAVLIIVFFILSGKKKK